MKKVFNKIKERVTLAFKEFMNITTDILVPLMSVLIFVAELLPIPLKYVRVLKRVEHWLFYAFATIEKINEKMNDEFDKE